MTYLVDYDELHRLAKGELKVDDVAIPENIALLTWSGSDVKYQLENIKKQKNISIDEGTVNDIAELMGDGNEIGDFLTYAIQEWLRQENKT